MNTLSFESLPDDAPFEWLLDMFFRSESVACFSGQSDEEEIDGAMREMAAGRLEPVQVEELFGKVRSDSSAVARLASILQESKVGVPEAKE
jgi:hypothetical protein